MRPEQPAEQQEQLAAQLADVLLDQQAHGLAVVLDAGIQGAEVGDSAEKDAAQQNPEQDGQPAEGRGLDGAGDRAGAGDGAELMAEHGPAVGGNVVLAVVETDGRGFGGGINAPGPGDPAPIEGVGRNQAHRRDQDDNECVHDFPLLLFLDLAQSQLPVDEKSPRPCTQSCNWMQRRRLNAPRYHFACRPGAAPLPRQGTTACTTCPVITVGFRRVLMGAGPFAPAACRGWPAGSLLPRFHLRRLSGSGVRAGRSCSSHLVSGF